MSDEVSGTEARVCHDIARRQQLGIAKYGTTVAENPLSLREWLDHAYQECLDQAVYLRRAMEELDRSVRFQVGDCVILNYCERPCGALVCVVVGKVGEKFLVQYLSADQVLDTFCNPPMECSLDEATKIEDFGVSLKISGIHYWCEKITESSATYKDGKPRIWQEISPVTHYIRPTAYRIHRKASEWTLMR